MKINNFFQNKIDLYKDLDNLSKEILISKAASLSELGISNDTDSRKYFLLKKASDDLGIELSLDEKKKLLRNEIINMNDAYYYIVDNKLNSLNKKAYPNFTSYTDVQPEFDLNKWLKIVHNIYDAVQNKKMDKEAAIDYYSNFLDKETEEDIKFKKWFKFYGDGEHLKYSKDGDNKMKKKALFMSGLTPSGNQYDQGGVSAYRVTAPKTEGFNLPGTSFDEPEVDNTKSDTGDERFEKWKEDLFSTIRRMNKLLPRNRYLDPDTFAKVNGALSNLISDIYKIKSPTTASDVTSRAANSLMKYGEVDGAKILRKFAQEVPSEEAAATPAPAQTPSDAPPAAAGTPEVPAAVPDEAKPTGTLKDKIPTSDEVKPVNFEDIKPIPGPAEGEYDGIVGDVNLGHAAKKLDEVAGMLADRRMIRYLAEFDIMLDKIGIASMFPELAEAQSKLIEAYSYALTRVTKMMGQLSNAQSLMLASKPEAVPGTPTAAEEKE